MKKILISFFVLLFSFISNAYPPLSPYSYCGGDPVNCIDPTGEDIVVLNFGHDIMHQHLAMLIQNKDGKWQYYSVNGDNVYISGEHKGGRLFNDVAVGSWDSPQEFLNSSYNVKNDNSKEDKSMNNYGFSEGYHIPTTPEQDAIMRDSFAKIANTKYNLVNNNCATAVQQVMIDAVIPVSEPTMEPTTIPMSTPFGLVDVFNGYKMKCDMSIIPQIAFESIMEWNRGGEYLHR